MNQTFTQKKIFITLFLILSLFFTGAVSTVYASDYVSEDSIFVNLVYRDQLRFQCNQNFVDIYDIAPGDYFKDTVTIHPDCKEAVAVQLEYFKSREENPFIDQMQLKVQYGGQVIYEGDCKLDQPISLGKMEKEDKTLEFEIYFPYEATNEWQGKSGRVWLSLSAKVGEDEEDYEESYLEPVSNEGKKKFTMPKNVQVKDGAYENSKDKKNKDLADADQEGKGSNGSQGKDGRAISTNPVRTGDDTAYDGYIVAAALSLVALLGSIIIIINRKRKTEING